MEKRLAFDPTGHILRGVTLHLRERAGVVHACATTVSANGSATSDADAANALDAIESVLELHDAKRDQFAQMADKKVVSPLPPEESALHQALRVALQETLAAPLTARSMDILVQQARATRNLVVTNGAKRAGAMFGVVDHEPEIGFGSNPGYDAPIPVQTLGGETYGAQILRALEPWMEKIMEASSAFKPAPPQQSTSDMVIAISMARQQGLHELADSLEAKLCGHAVTTVKTASTAPPPVVDVDGAEVVAGADAE